MVILINLKILSWTVCGLNDKDKRMQVKNALKVWRADIVYLQETKLEVISRAVIRSLWGSLFVDLDFLVVEGASGGVLALWDRTSLEKTESERGCYLLSCKFKNEDDKFFFFFFWAFYRVYNPKSNLDRKMLWEELTWIYVVYIGIYMDRL